MKIIDKIKSAKSTLFSFELLPPLKGKNIDSIYSSIDPLLEFNPFAINITYHQEEVVYKKMENGLIRPTTTRKRPGTVAISAAIQYHYRDIVDVVPHLICGGFTKEETEYALLDLNFLDIHNILVLRGDPLKTQRMFTPEKGGNAHASELVEQIVNMNKGIYLDENLKWTSPTDFSIGVAGYPEKHCEAPNMNTDMEYLKKKVEKGADYIVTQMFFDNSKFFNFVELCRHNNINVPIIPGIKPIVTKNDVAVLPKIFSIDIPEPLVKEVDKCKTNEQVWQVGVEWCTQQSKELIKYGAPVVHYYTIGQPDNIHKIATEVF